MWEFCSLSFYIFHPKNIGYSLQETPLFFPSSSVDAPSILHRYSIDGPSFRWRIDGGLMEYRWSISRFSYTKYLYFLLLVVCFHILLDLFGGFRKKNVTLHSKDLRPCASLYESMLTPLFYQKMLKRARCYARCH